MIYTVCTERFDGYCIAYTYNARLVSAPNEEEAIRIYKQAMEQEGMKKFISRKKIHVYEFNIPYGYIDTINVDGKEYPSSRQQAPNI